MVPEELLDLYSSDLDYYKLCYRLMGKMLDTDLIHERLRYLNSNEIYVYDSGYLGIQLFHALNDHVNVPAIVDKSGCSILRVPDIPIIDLEVFFAWYNGQKVIIASLKKAGEIKKELSTVVSENDMVFVNEFLEGIMDPRNPLDIREKTIVDRWQ